jgi:hypothetical protein
MYLQQLHSPWYTLHKCLIFPGLRGIFKKGEVEEGANGNIRDSMALKQKMVEHISTKTTQSSKLLIRLAFQGDCSGSCTDD